MTNEMEVPATTQAKPKKQGFFGHYVKTKLKEASKNKTLYLFMLPFLVLFVIFTVMPVVTAIYYSFTYFNVLEPPQFIFWDNYVRMFVADDLFMTAFKNTLLFAAILGPCGYILSFFFAWLINEFSPKIRAVLTLIYYAPSLANIYVVWKLIFDSSNYGLLNGILMDLGLIYTNIRWLEDVNYIVGCVIVVLLWSSLGVSFLTFTAGLQNVDRSLYEAGRHRRRAQPLAGIMVYYPALHAAPASLRRYNEHYQRFLCRRPDYGPGRLSNAGLCRAYNGAPYAGLWRHPYGDGLRLRCRNAPIPADGGLQ